MQLEDFGKVLTQGGDMEEQNPQDKFKTEDKGAFWLTFFLFICITFVWLIYMIVKQ